MRVLTPPPSVYPPPPRGPEAPLVPWVPLWGFLARSVRSEYVPMCTGKRRQHLVWGEGGRIPPPSEFSALRVYNMLTVSTINPPKKFSTPGY